jgi:hypothetical protein
MVSTGHGIEFLMHVQFLISQFDLVRLICSLCRAFRFPSD